MTIFSSFGLNTSLLNAFGTTSGKQTGALFSPSQVQSFIKAELGFNEEYTLNFSYEGYVDKLLDAQSLARSAGFGQLADVYSSILTNFAVAESYGLNINGITSSLDSSGNVVVNTNLGGASINLTDALNTAINSGQIPTAIEVPGFGTISPGDIFGLFFN